MQLQDRRILALLILLPVLLFADVIFLGENFFLLDLFEYHYPMKRVVRDTIAAGEFPFWTRAFAGGQPMAANPAYEVFYPPQWLIFAGSFDRGFAFHILFHVFLALTGMYAFLRALDLQWRAALFGAVSFGTSGFLLGSIAMLPTFFVWSWAPSAGWAIARLWRNFTPRRFAVAALILGIQALVGEPMALIQVWALAAVVILLVARPISSSANLVRLLSLLVAASAIAAVQLLPAMDHARDSKRRAGFDYESVVDRSMPPERVIEMAVPRVFGLSEPQQDRGLPGAAFGRRPYLLSIYAGLAVVILSLAGVVSRLPGTAALLIISGGAYLLAIGDATPIYRWLFDAGLARSIRYPEKFAAAAVFSLVVFASFGAERLFAGDGRFLRAARGAAITCTAISAAAFALTLSGSAFLRLWGLTPDRTDLLSAARSTLGAGLLIATVWCVLVWRADRAATPLWGTAALIVLLADVSSAGRSLVPAMPAEFFTPPPVTRDLVGDRESFAIFHRGRWRPYDENYQKGRILSPHFAGRNMLLGLTPAAWGFRTILEPDLDETFLIPTHDLLNAMVARARSGDPRWDEPFMDVSNVRYVLDFRSAEQDMAEAGGDLMRSRPVNVFVRPNRGRYYFTTSHARVLSMQETANSASIDVAASAPATLFAAVTRHKYWSATIDGQPATLVPANIAYQALTVPAGRHRVQMRYRNPVVVSAGVLSMIAASAAIITILKPPPLRPRSGS